MRLRTFWKAVSLKKRLLPFVGVLVSYLVLSFIFIQKDYLYGLLNSIKAEFPENLVIIVPKNFLSSFGIGAQQVIGEHERRKAEIVPGVKSACLVCLSRKPVQWKNKTYNLFVYYVEDDCFHQWPLLKKARMPSHKGALIGHDIADVLDNIRVGKTIKIDGQNYKIADILDPSSNEFSDENSAVFIRGKGNGTCFVSVDITPGTLSLLNRTFADYKVMSSEDTKRIFKEVFDAFDLLILIVSSLTAMASLVASLSSLMSIFITEKKHFSTLHALGLSKSKLDWLLIRTLVILNVVPGIIFAVPTRWVSLFIAATSLFGSLFFFHLYFRG